MPDRQPGNQFSRADHRARVDQFREHWSFRLQAASCRAETVKNSRLIVSWKEELLGGEAPRQPYASMIADGSWSAGEIAGELGDVILGKVAARRKEAETVVFESVGMSLLGQHRRRLGLPLGAGEKDRHAIFIGVKWRCSRASVGVNWSSFSLSLAREAVRGQG